MCYLDGEWKGRVLVFLLHICLALAYLKEFIHCMHLPMMLSLRTPMQIVLLLIWCSVAVGEPGKCREGVAKDITAHHLLMQDVFCSYDKDVRPSIKHSDNVTATIKLFVKFFSFDELNSVMHIHTWMALTWTDAYLKWSPSDYGNISVLHVSIRDIWVPDLSIYNSGDLSVSMGFRRTQCLIFPDSMVLCVPAIKWPAYCQAVFRLWPFDMHECKLTIGSWNHHGEAVDIKMSDAGYSLDDYVQSKEWELKNVTALVNVSVYECCPNETYPTAEYTFIIKRHASAYAATVVIPVLVLVGMTLSTFWLPAELPHRLSLCLVSIVCHCLYLQYLGAKLPSNGDVTPVIVLLFRGSLIICGAAVAWSVALLSLSCESAGRDVGKNTSLIECRLLEIIQKPWIAQILCVGHLFSKSAPADGEERDDAAVTVAEGGFTRGWLIVSTALDHLAFYVFTVAYACMLLALIPN
ncbi:acetylcholine receptor subunit alpha-type acr-16-like isoform X1 [Ischnura elegans]|uniref:acetylcholine receptor subunit alpha-type acr-16-like isoform X1 n=2 Tax=Ischnura elegans TaxID=197161 RepID=UPI001ED87826|nr:acetylcholine receptor subunit alpha-type acr-16-like isoform X1 [Ischnura elegans]